MTYKANAWVGGGIEKKTRREKEGEEEAIVVEIKTAVFLIGIDEVI